MTNARNQTLLAVAIIAAAALMLYLMGRAPICTCGTVKPWHGVVVSSENSQHLTDWYTFSHVIHGFVFYLVAWLALKATGREVTVLALLPIALAVEAGWEIFENTDFVINRYREATISRGYYGDSVINSVFDMLAMVVGFVLAARLPVWMVVAAAVAMELFTLLMIRDSLALNTLMLVWPLDAVRDWQAGA